MDDISGIQNIIAQFLTMLNNDLVAYLAQNNRNATGRSSASIQPANISEIGGQLVGNSSIQWVFTGRGPGGFPPLSNIIDWLNARGLPRGMAWAVAKKIAEEGTKLWQSGVNGFQEVITQEKIDAFSKDISVLVAVDINSDIESVFA